MAPRGEFAKTCQRNPSPLGTYSMSMASPKLRKR